MGKIQGFILYRIWYGNDLVYLGRTKQPLQTRLHGHFFKKPMHRSISINLVTKIEYAMFPTESDMNLYEIYFINLWKPALNIDDKCKDELTVLLLIGVLYLCGIYPESKVSHFLWKEVV